MNEQVEATRAEVCAIACAEVWRGDGEVMASPFGTVPALGARVARLTFEPDLVITDGEAALIENTPPVGASLEEMLPEAWMPFRQVFQLLWAGRRHIMMMASQVDRFGNQNLSFIGERSKPKAQLIGVRGAPGNTINHTTSYWVPNHSPRTFVEHVDAVCGVGYDKVKDLGTAARFHEIRRVVSNLGVFDFDTPDHSMRLRSVHPGVTVDQVIEATGFELALNHRGDLDGDGDRREHSSGAVRETRLPSGEELELIRNILDPRGLRDQEVR